MPGSYLLLDKLGETMTSFWQHDFAYRREHGQPGFANGQHELIGEARSGS